MVVHMRERSDQLLTVSTVFLSICVWQSDSMWSPPESPERWGWGAMAGHGQGQVLRGFPSKAGKSGVSMPQGRKQEDQRVDQSEKPLVNSEIDRM